MALDIGIIVAAEDAHSACLGDGPVFTRAVFTGVLCELGNIAIGWSGREWRASDLDYGAEPCFIGHGGLAQHHMVDTPVDAIDGDTDPVAQFVGRFLADDPADHRDRGRPAMQEDAFRAPRLTARGEGAVNGLDDIAAFAQFPQSRFEPIRKVLDAGLDLPRQPKASQHLQAPDTL